MEAIKSRFQCSLVDAGSRQPELVIGSDQPHCLVWRLTNTDGQVLEVTPFPSGEVGETQHHFKFALSQAVLTGEPALPGWQMALGKDANGNQLLFIAFTGKQPLAMQSGEVRKATFCYAGAIETDKNNPSVSITVFTGQNVKWGGQAVNGEKFGPMPLALVSQNANRIAAAPLAAGFVGRPMVLNDGNTGNELKLAITNVTLSDVVFDKNTFFEVWFAAAPNKPGTDADKNSYDWALAEVHHLEGIKIDVASKDSGWTVVNPVTADARLAVERDATRSGAVGNPASNPHWSIKAADADKAPGSLKPQTMLFFTVSKVRTTLPPGIARMYLKYRNLPNYSDGVLIAEVEKAPALYGSTRGEGLYVSAGIPHGSTPPAVKYESGLYVHQFNPLQPAATFEGGSGVSVTGGVIVHQSDSTKLTASFEGGSGVSVTGEVYVQQIDSARLAATFTGGSGVLVKGKLTATCAEVNGKLSVAEDIEVGTFEDNRDRFIMLKTKWPGGDDRYRTGIKFRVYKDDYGFSIVNDDGNKASDDNPYGKQGLNILRHDGGKPVSVLFISRSEGEVSIGKNVDIGTFNDKEDRYITLKTSGGADKSNRHKSGIKLKADSDSWGFTIEHDDTDGHAGLSILKHNDGETQSAMFISRVDGSVHINGDLTIDGSLKVKQWIENWFNETSWWGLAQPNPRRDQVPAYWDKNPSDSRLKSGVVPIRSALEKLSGIRGTTFRWNQDALNHFAPDIEESVSAGPNTTREENRKLWLAERKKRHEHLTGLQVGVIAQDVEAVLPEAVTTDAAGYKCVRYHYLIPLLIEAVKEQDQVVKDQALTIAKQQAEIEHLTRAQQAMQQQLEELSALRASLSRLEAAMQSFAGSGVLTTNVH